ncbi:aspartic proteinase nepenthesin-1-like [Typha angustifolia]|uniref:aspartic proteinase nepenthesin-1-like n=1 Tax=Typha angustifolia TaxID=59011 RepID=UPI003C2B2ABB
MGNTLLQLLMLLMVFFLPLSCSTFTGTRVELTYIDSKGNFNKSELIQRALARDKIHLASFTASLSSTDASALIHWGSASYIMDFAIGTPGQVSSVLVATGSDLIWTQCQPCSRCFPQSTPIYDPAKSSTFKKLPCDGALCQALPDPSCNPDCSYSYSYLTGSSTRGVLASETFTLGSTDPVSIPDIGFGCSTLNIGPQDSSSGILGLGRGPLSLVSQLDVGKFSYCLTSYLDNSTSPLLLGSTANLNGIATQSTPFVTNPTIPYLSSFYYLSLKGITVGKTLVPISKTAFQLNADGSGGFIIDSTTTITYLIEEAYQLVKQEFISQMTFPPVEVTGALDICFEIPPSTSSVSVPKLVFHFEGADMELPAANYFIFYETYLCLMMNSLKGASIFGNFQQQNMHILYDLANGALSFEPAECNKL